jgi:hypothetical protein
MRWGRLRSVCLAAFVAAVALCDSSGSFAQSSLPVVPGGEGFGITTRAAYGCGFSPAILRVTNLNDSGPGSLRDALTAAGPRVVIFEVSGNIVLGSDINIVTDCITVAGQTAPSPGITIRDGGLNVYARNVLLQHLRIRPGDGGQILPQTAAHNATLVYTAFGYQPDNVVFDHLSMSWSGGKVTNNATWGAADGKASIAYWRCIISESLYYAKNVIVDPGQPSGLGMLIAGYDSEISIIGSLFAHNNDRNPEIHEASQTNFVNNVIYDWGKDSHNYTWATLFYAPVAGPWRANLVGNKYISGPGPYSFTPLYAIGTWSGDWGSQVYINDNAIDGGRQPVMDYHNNMPFDPRVSSPPVSLDGVTVRPSSTIESLVLATAGARPADRDPVDSRIVNEVTSRTGRVISSQDQVGGWPTLAVNVRGLVIPANPHVVTASGYTNLENWLHNYAAEVERSSQQTSLLAPTNVHLIRAN